MSSPWLPLLRASPVRRSLRPPPFVGRAQVSVDLVPEFRDQLQAGAIYDVDADRGFELGLEPGLWFVYVGLHSRTFFWGRLSEQRAAGDELVPLESDDAAAMIDSPP